MGKRKGLSQRLRFEVFKRDGFRCVYCGSTPTDGPLHADHVKPVADGGEDVAGNLVTACRSCNGGKSAIPLEKRSLAPLDKDLAQEHVGQIRAWLEAQGQILDAKLEAGQNWVDYWCEAFGTSKCSQDVPSRLLRIEREWGTAKTCDAIWCVAYKDDLYSDTARLKYLYGVLRNWADSGDVKPAGGPN